MNKNGRDWSAFEEVFQDRRTRQSARYWTNPETGRPTETDARDVPVVAPLQDQRVLALRDEANSLLTRFKANAIRREAAIEGLRKVVSGQLEVLEHYVATAVLVKKSRVDVDVKEFLAQLDSEHLRILGQFNVKNMEQRARTLFDLNDRFVALVSEAQGREWPTTLIKETVRNLSDLYSRIATEINEDFPSRHQRRA